MNSPPARRNTARYHDRKGPSPCPGSCRQKTLRHVRWVERGGPTIAAALARHGVGSMLLKGVVDHQLNGSSAAVWEAEGLTFELALPSETSGLALTAI